MSRSFDGKPCLLNHIDSHKGDGKDAVADVSARPLPRYVEACRRGAWTLKLWKKANPADAKFICFRCGSWRCEGACRRWKGAQDFVRIKEGIEKWDYWTHVVLTFYQDGRDSIWEAFKDGFKRWSKLRKRLIRKYQTLKYIQTWEVHRSGFPHVHLAISNVDICEKSVPTPRDKEERRRVSKENFIRLIQPAAVKCGFGEIGWVERLDSKVSMAGYLSKLSRELTGSGKDYQIPIQAPPHFRRLRSTQGLLPPIQHDETISGELIMRPVAGRE